MTTKNYFTTELDVHFTCSELYDIATALATEALNERKNENINNANRAWNLRSKVREFIDLYKNSAVL